MAVYLVKTPSGEKLVEAKTASAAINYAFDKDDFTAKSVSASEVVAYMARGLKVEYAPAKKAA